MAPPVKVGLNIVWIKPELLGEFAVFAEDLGFESLWSGEHVCLSTDADWWKLFPGATMIDGFTEDMVPFHPDSVFLDPLIALAHVATVTSRVRLGVGIYMLALRDPVLVGKTLASLDVLSGGRIDLAVGLGWTADEYAWTGNEWKVRGKRMNEIIRALRVLFEDDHPEFHGDFFDFGPMGFQPKPVQQPMPIHIGGGAGPAVRRAGALGDGWYGSPTDIPAIREELAANGRQDAPFEFSSLGGLGTLAPLEELHAMAEMGVDRVVVTPFPGKKVGEVGREGFAILEQYAKDLGL